MKVCGEAADFSSQTGFAEMTEERLAEPEVNVEIGCWYLKRSLDDYRNSPQPTLFALLRYNAGKAKADDWLRAALTSPPRPGTSSEQHCLSLVDFPKTRLYAQRILERSRSRRFPL
jgi:soluble lytic murein transglycosylase